MDTNEAAAEVTIPIGVQVKSLQENFAKFVEVFNANGQTLQGMQILMSILIQKLGMSDEEVNKAIEVEVAKRTARIANRPKTSDGPDSNHTGDESATLPGTEGN